MCNFRLVDGVNVGRTVPAPFRVTLLPPVCDQANVKGDGPLSGSDPLPVKVTRASLPNGPIRTGVGDRRLIDRQRRYRHLLRAAGQVAGVVGRCPNDWGGAHREVRRCIVGQRWCDIHDIRNLGRAEIWLLSLYYADVRRANQCRRDRVANRDVKATARGVTCLIGGGARTRSWCRE